MNENGCVRRMSDARSMLARFKEIAALAFDLKKALKFANLEENDLKILRQKVMKVEIVPKSILDHQVRAFFCWKLGLL